MTVAPEVDCFDVLLGDELTGVLRRRNDNTWFVLDQSYVENPSRSILGLRFEEDLHARHRANRRLPPWFSNLLPEGKLREWIAHTRGVSVAREMELLAGVGLDLPGAVVVRPATSEIEDHGQRDIVTEPPDLIREPTWRFSLAGIQMKLSMLQSGDRFTAPAVGQDGDWIIKLPDATFPNVPQNEFATMELARACGIEVPETRLIHRDELPDVPSRFWPSSETLAYAIRRFDRSATGRIHIEDLAQVRNFYPDNKYDGTFETVANHIYRGKDTESLIEFARRLTVIVVVRNGDAHLKNWSLIYRNPRSPTLAPAYDLVSTAVYVDGQEDLGLKLGRSRRFEDVSLASFDQLGARIKVSDVSLSDVAADTANAIKKKWPDVRDEHLADVPLVDDLDETITHATQRLRR